MRPGLVLLGVGGLALGIGLALVGGFWNYPTQYVDTTIHSDSVTLSPRSSLTLVLNPGTGTVSYELTIDSDVPVSASLWSCNGAASACLRGTLSNESSGSWTVSSPPATLYLTLSDPGPQSASTTITTRSSSTMTSGFNWYEEFLVLGGATVLLAGAGVAIFLGLFLRGNPYAQASPAGTGERPPPPEPPS